MKPGFGLCSVLPTQPSSTEPSLPSLEPAHPYRGSSFRLQVGGVAWVLLSPCKGEPRHRGGDLQHQLELSGLNEWCEVTIVTGHQRSSAIGQTAPEHAFTHLIFLLMSLPFRGDSWQFSVLVVSAKVIQKCFFCPYKLVIKKSYWSRMWTEDPW